MTPQNVYSTTNFHLIFLSNPKNIGGLKWSDLVGGSR